MRMLVRASTFGWSIIALAFIAAVVAVPRHAAPQTPLPEVSAAWGPVGVFAAAKDCAECHRATPFGVAPAAMRQAAPGASISSPVGSDIGPLSAGKHSMMAHSLNDPYFRAVVADEVHHFPSLAGAIEDKCLTCHAPMARTHAHASGEGLDADGHFRMSLAITQMHAREGVSCTVCHQIADDGLLGVSSSGRYTIAQPPAAALIFGPYPNPVGQAMQQATGYTPTYGAHLDNPAFCAVCHTLYTPTVDVDSGQPTGSEFLEQAPYLEWHNSSYAQPGTLRSCQGCHMPAAPPEAFRTPIAIRPSGTINTAWPERQPYFQHEQVGANVYALQLLRVFRALLGIEQVTEAQGFDLAIAATRDLLARAAGLQLSGSLVDGELQLIATVSNRSGHKLPTGFPSRRVWIELRVDAADGRRIFESGVADASGRLVTDIAATAADCVAVQKPVGFDPQACYEPHRDLITRPTQVAIYEAVMGNTRGEATYVLLHAARYLKDNRLPPAGFDPGSTRFVPGTESVGVDTDPDFNRSADSLGSGADRVHYRIELADSQPPYRVEAALRYQSISPAFVEVLARGADPAIDDFVSMHKAHPPMPETLATAALVIGGEGVFVDSFEGTD